ncbi:MAG: acetylglutamate kinase [Phycisphaeraceae bacterium]|nr:acetylglutamate kinase [Phycisphaeraceae bacterium]
MQDAITKAAALVEAHEYIRRFEGKVVVVKVGGSIMDEPATLNSLIMDICFMDAVGLRPVIVHGGGKSITDAMKKAGLEAQFVQGRRYTDERTLAIVEHVLVNEVNKSIVDEINRLEHKGMGLHTLGSAVVFGRRMFLEVPGEGGGRKVDIGYVGEVESINARLILALLEADYIPVIAPVGRDSAGGRLNINADSVAGHVAAALKAEKLILVSDTHGIRTSDDAKSLASTLTRKQIDELTDKGVITAGMLPKVEACITAIEAGVPKTHIIDGRIPHSLMLEIYTNTGIGTEIVL